MPTNTLIHSNASYADYQESLVGNRLMTFMVAIELFAYLAETLLSPYFFLKLMKVNLLHTNLRVILCNMPILFVVMSFHRFHFLVEYLIIHVFGNETYASLSFERCLVIRFFYDWTICVLAFAIPMFTLERILATWKPEKYERTSSPKMGFAVTCFLYVASLGYATAFFVVDLFYREPWFDTVGRLFCSVLYTRPTAFFCLAWSCFGAYFCCIPILIGLYKYNRNKVYQYGQQQLNVRYQYSENLAAIRSLFSSISCYGFALVVQVINVFIQFVEKNNSSSVLEHFQKVWFLEQLFNIILAFYMLVHCGTFFVSYAPMNRLFWKDFGWIRVQRWSRVNDSADNDAENRRVRQQTETYFAQINSQWK
ncbi:hypothetical protein L596_019379 [Steinernema carpocapsae]|uniref:G-protein coupled receptors family 1 profile domain-containing protein n=1 Tax=Steinernema carpocapsae TaxID=34508 RepID=A0A4U5MQB5_STECR|nr:hypothetical protein L596_019379 [Steinernema carpocapsae]